MTAHAKAKRWRVVEQTSHLPDREVCAHRWEWAAERRARKLTRREPGTGIFFTARPAEVTR